MQSEGHDLMDYHFVIRIITDVRDAELRRKLTAERSLTRRTHESSQQLDDLMRTSGRTLAILPYTRTSMVAEQRL